MEYEKIDETLVWSEEEEKEQENIRKAYDEHKYGIMIMPETNLFEAEEVDVEDLPNIYWCKTKEECVEHMKNYIYLFPYCEKDFRFMTLCSYEDFMKQ